MCHTNLSLSLSSRHDFVFLSSSEIRCLLVTHPTAEAKRPLVPIRSHGCWTTIVHCIKCMFVFVQALHTRGNTSCEGGLLTSLAHGVVREVCQVVEAEGRHRCTLRLAPWQRVLVSRVSALEPSQRYQRDERHQARLGPTSPAPSVRNSFWSDLYQRLHTSHLRYWASQYSGGKQVLSRQRGHSGAARSSRPEQSELNVVRRISA